MQPRYYAVAAFVLVLALAGAAWAVRTDGATVDIQQAYFVAASPAEGDLNLTASLFVTNAARRASDDVSVVVFVVPTHTGLSSFTTRVNVGAIPPGTTQQASVPVVVPQFNGSRSYRVDFLVFEDDLLTQRGSGSVGWGGGGFYDVSGKMDYAAEGLAVSAPSFSRVG